MEDKMKLLRELLPNTITAMATIIAALIVYIQHPENIEAAFSIIVIGSALLFIIIRSLKLSESNLCWYRDLVVIILITIMIICGIIIVVSMANQIPVIDSLTANVGSPQFAGIVITWTTSATDPENDQLLYKFFLNGTSTNNKLEEKTGWISTNTWTWTTSQADVGSNQIEVWVRDRNHAGPMGFDSNEVANFVVMLINQKPKIISLSSEPLDSTETGSVVRWTATATDQDNDQIFYRFFLRGKPVTNWSMDNDWVWGTSESDIGQSLVEVRVREERNAAPEGFDDYRIASFKITGPALSSPTPSTLPTSTRINNVPSEMNKSPVYNQTSGNPPNAGVASILSIKPVHSLERDKLSAGEEIIFSGEAVPNSNVTGYQWRSPQESPNLLGRGHSISHTFKNAGNYEIIFEVFYGNKDNPATNITNILII